MIIEQTYWFAVTPDTEVLCPDGAWRTGQSLPSGADPAAPVIIRTPSHPEALLIILTAFPGATFVPSDQNGAVQ